MKGMAISIAIKAEDKATKPVLGITNTVVRSLHNMENASERMSGRMKRAFKSPLGGLVGAAAAYLTYDKLSEAYGRATAAARERGNSERQLSVLMGNAPGGTKLAISATKSYAVQLEKTYAINRLSTMAMAAQLSTYRLSPTLVRKAILPLMNYGESLYGIRITGDQAVDVVKKIARALIAQPGALTRAGIGLSTHEKKMWAHLNLSQRLDLAIKKLNQRYRNVAAIKAAAGSGKEWAYELKIIDMQANIGKKLLPIRASFLELKLAAMPLVQTLADKLFPAIDSAIPKLTKFVNTFTKWTKDNPKAAIGTAKLVAGLVGFVALVGPIGKIAGGVGSIIKGLTIAGPAIGTAVKWFMTFGVSIESIVALVGPIGLVVAAVAAVGVAAYLVYKNWAKVKAFFVGLWKWLHGNSPLASLIRDTSPLLLAAKLIVTNWTGVKFWFASFGKWLSKLWSGIANSAAFKAIVSAGSWVGKRAVAAEKWAVTDQTARPTIPTGKAAINAGKVPTPGNSRVELILKNVPHGSPVRSSLAPGHSLKVGYNHVNSV